MAKFIPDTIIDGQLDAIVSGATTMHLLTDQPTTFADIAALEVANGTLTGAITKANGDTSGRKATIPAQSGLAIDANGDADHVATSNGTDTLYGVTTNPIQGLVSGGTVDVAAFDFEILDPA